MKYNVKNSEKWEISAKVIECNTRSGLTFTTIAVIGFFLLASGIIGFISNDFSYLNITWNISAPFVGMIFSHFYNSKN